MKDTKPTGSPSGKITHHAQYGSVPAFYLFNHSDTGLFDVRGMGVELPEGWQSLSDANRLDFAAKIYRPMGRDEMMHNSIEWSRRSAMKLANAMSDGENNPKT